MVKIKQNVSAILKESNYTGVPGVTPFLEGTLFRDVVECWKNI
jgi:hypothetical protein